MSQPWAGLATAVVRQWRDDGKPRGDEEGARLWEQIIEAHRQRMLGAIKHGVLHTPERKEVIE